MTNAEKCSRDRSTQWEVVIFVFFVSGNTRGCQLVTLVRYAGSEKKCKSLRICDPISETHNAGSNDAAFGKRKGIMVCAVSLFSYALGLVFLQEVTQKKGRKKPW